MVSMLKENLPHDGCYLVCCEGESKKESSKSSNDFVIGYQRGWTIVKPSFVEWAAKERMPPILADHAMDLSPLAALSASACGATQHSVDQLRFR